MGRVGRHRLDYLGHTDTGQLLSIHKILEQMPEAGEIASIEAEQPLNQPSINFGTEQWLILSKTINGYLRDDPSLAGVVLTHGIGTLDETAYFLNLTIKDPRPVVVTGTMRPPSSFGSDAEINLIGAIRVAGSGAAANRGVLVLLNNEISAAREALPSSTSHLESFRPGDFGFLGLIDHFGEVVFYRSPTRKHTHETAFDVSQISSLPRVDIVHVYQGADGTLVRAAVEAGARGLVFASIGPAGGLMPAMENAAREAASAGVAIVLSSRLGGGRVPLLKVREGTGLIAADNLPPQKARVLLTLALTIGDDPAEIARCFSEY
jgi:L-asparaginase